MYSSSTSGTAIEDLSHYTALLVFLLYFMQLLFQFKTHSQLYAAEAQHDEVAEMSYRDSIILLLGSTLFVCPKNKYIIHYQWRFAAKPFSVLEV